MQAAVSELDLACNLLVTIFGKWCTDNHKLRPHPHRTIGRSSPDIGADWLGLLSTLSSDASGTQIFLLKCSSKQRVAPNCPAVGFQAALVHSRVWLLLARVYRDFWNVRRSRGSKLLLFSPLIDSVLSPANLGSYPLKAR